MGKIIGGDQSSRQYGNSVPISMLSPLPNLRNNMFIVNNVLRCGRFMPVVFQIGLQADAAPAFPQGVSLGGRGQSRQIGDWYSESQIQGALSVHLSEVMMRRVRAGTGHAPVDA